MEKTDEQEKATNFALKYLEHLIEKELAMEKQTYVAPGCEVVYVRMEMNIMSQMEGSTIGEPLIPGGNSNRYYDPYHDVGE